MQSLSYLYSHNGFGKYCADDEITVVKMLIVSLVKCDAIGATNQALYLFCSLFCWKFMNVNLSPVLVLIFRNISPSIN